ncbi:TolC family protein [Compostibacter hankyongensis]|uniref:TolC family protein n=1 Tax=Compostibacter hankyongensis TaxID=1007089 RepID=A0ABP8FTY7_9BACT
MTNDPNNMTRIKTKQRSLGSFLLLAACCLGGTATAQQEMTLDNAIAIGLKNNYDILMARNQADISANDYHYAFGAFLPTLSASASRTWSQTQINQKYSDGRAQNKSNTKSDNLDASADLNWTLFDGLKMFATRDKLKAIVASGELSFKNQVVNTIAGIITTYYNIVQQKQQLQAISEQMSISEERVKIAANKFQSGLGSKIDQLQAQVDLNAQKAAYLQQQTAIAESKASLNQLIAMPADRDYAVADSIPVNRSLTYDSLRGTVFEQNPGLLLAKNDITVSQLTLKELQRSRLPTISFNSSYSFSRQNSGAGFFLFNQNKGLQYGFSAFVPIFQGFNQTRQIKDARLDIAYRELNLQNTRSQVDVALLNSFKEYDYYRKALALEEENLGVAQENVKVALEAFRQGQTSSLEVKEAQQGLADATYRLISARYNVKVSETALLQLKGDLLQ